MTKYANYCVTYILERTQKTAGIPEYAREFSGRRRTCFLFLPLTSRRATCSPRHLILIIKNMTVKKLKQSNVVTDK